MRRSNPYKIEFKILITRRFFPKGHSVNPLCASEILRPFAIAHNGLKPVVIKKVNKILDGVVFCFLFLQKKEWFFCSFLTIKKNRRFDYLVK